MLVAIVLLLITSYSASLRTWWQQRQDIRAVETEITRREAAIAKLEDDAQRFDDPAYIERQARERFGWVFPGEVGYRVIGADGEVEGNAPQLAEPPSEADPPWYDTLGRSVEAAGAEPVKPEPAPTTPAQPLEPSQ